MHVDLLSYTAMCRVWNPQIHNGIYLYILCTSFGWWYIPVYTGVYLHMQIHVLSLHISPDIHSHMKQYIKVCTCTYRYMVFLVRVGGSFQMLTHSSLHVFDVPTVNLHLQYALIHTSKYWYISACKFTAPFIQQTLLAQPCYSIQFDTGQYI